MSEENTDVGMWVFQNMQHNIIGNGIHDRIVADKMRQPHQDFPVSAKSGSRFEEKEND